MQKTSSWRNYAELASLFFFHGMAMAMWFISLSNVLDSYGFHAIKPFAFATSGVAAFLSPLLFGAIADRHLGPVPVFRWLSIGVAGALTLVTASLAGGARPWVVLGLIQLLALFALPTWSIINAIVLAGLKDSQRQFGPVRAMGTIGWMAGCWVVSLLDADSSILSGYSAILGWLFVAAFTFFLPNIAPPKATEKLTLKQRFGLDALALLKHPDHKVVFLTSALVTMPLVAFYPFTPPHLKEFGLEHTSAWMTLGQVTEIIAMFSLSTLLLKWRLKWIFLVGLSCALLRYIFCAMNSKGFLLAGISLHGFAFTFFFVTAPIYLDGRVDPQWRARAQALMTLMTSGFGNLIGYLGCGWWFQVCERGAVMRWSLFWGGLAAVVAVVLIYFVLTYRGQPQPEKAPKGFSR